MNDPCFASFTCEFCKVINEILKPSLDNLLNGSGEGSGNTEVVKDNKHHGQCRWVDCCWGKDGSQDSKRPLCKRYWYCKLQLPWFCSWKSGKKGKT